MRLAVLACLLTSCTQGSLGDLPLSDDRTDDGQSFGDTLDDAAPAGDATPSGDPTTAGDPSSTGDPHGPGDPGGTSELLLFDGANRQFTYDDNGFHVLLSPGNISGNWSSPLDYYEGEFHVRYVITAPSDQQAGRLQTCIWTMGNEDGDGRNYFPESCSGQASHTGVDEYFNDNLVPSSWWKLDNVPLDFSHPERFLIRVVLRGTSGCNVTRYSVSDPCWEEWPTYENMVFRVTIVMVGPDDTFSGWQNYP